MARSKRCTTSSSGIIQTSPRLTSCSRTQSPISLAPFQWRSEDRRFVGSATGGSRVVITPCMAVDGAEGKAAWRTATLARTASTWAWVQARLVEAMYLERAHRTSSRYRDRNANPITTSQPYRDISERKDIAAPLIVVFL